MIASVDAGKLFELVWASALAGVLVAVCFSLVIVGFTHAVECQRSDRSVAAVAYGVLTVVALVLFFGLAVFGITVIATK